MNYIKRSALRPDTWNLRWLERNRYAWARKVGTKLKSYRRLWIELLGCFIALRQINYKCPCINCNITTSFKAFHFGHRFACWCRGTHSMVRWLQETSWRHPMEACSALLALCVRNSPVPGEFPAQWPVTWSFDVFFGLRLNKRLSKQSWGWLFETPSRPLWRHCNGNIVC